MQLKHLRTFIAVASARSLTRAGEKLHLAPSSVSEQIQALELDLGATLFERSSRRLVPTAAGLRLLDYAGGILTLCDEARAAVAEESDRVAGRVAVGGVDSLCLARIPALVAQYCANFPGVQVMVRPGKTTDLHGGLKAGLLDVYFTFGAPPEAPDLRTEQIGTEQIVLVAPANHQLARRQHISFEDLGNEPFLVATPGCPMRNAFEEVYAGNASNRPRIVGEFASISAMRGLVEAGAGCALLPMTVAEPALASGRIVPLAWEGMKEVAISMTWRRRRAPPTALRHFLDAARSVLAA